MIRNKRTFHHYWRYMRPVKSYILLIAAVCCFMVGIIGLRDNNQQSIVLRDQLLQVDKENGDVESALRELRQHIYSHMNSELGAGEGSIRQPVQLVHTYQRLVDAEAKRVSEENETIYNDAQTHCEKTFPAGFFGAGRIGCIEDYVSQRGVEVRSVNEDLYKFDFVAPVWSPDAAGFGLLFGAIFTVLFIIRIAAERWIRFNHI